MNGVKLLLNQRACEYSRLVDFDQAERIADLFIPEGIWQSGRRVGQAQVRAGFRRRQFLKYPQISEVSPHLH